MPHDHPHPTADDHAAPDDAVAAHHGDGALTRWQTMEIALREILVEKGILTADEIAREIARMEARTPANGAAVVARAWTDAAFRDRLLADAAGASREMGFDIGPINLIAVENTENVHNIIVCTLCSCYPRGLLGLPPDWYKSREYRSRTVREPRSVLAEFGVVLPAGATVRVHDSTADMRYIVLPARPAGTEGWDVARLAALVTREAMVGTGLCHASKTPPPYAR